MHPRAHCHHDARPDPGQTQRFLTPSAARAGKSILLMAPVRRAPARFPGSNNYQPRGRSVALLI